MEPLLGMQDLAARYGLHVNTIRKWRMDGVGPVGFPVGRYIKYRAADVLAWEEQQRTQDAA